MVRIQSISDPVPDTNGNNFKVVTFEAPAFKEMVDLETGESVLGLAAPKTCKKCVWESSYLDQTKHYLYDAKPGQPVYGSIYTASTDEYEINDNAVSKVGVKYVSGDVTLSVGYSSGAGKDSTTLGTAGTKEDAVDSTDAGISYAVASGVTANIGWKNVDSQEAGASETSGGTAWYIGANMSF